MKNNFTDKYFYLTTYYVSSETDTESDSIYDGNEFNRAKLEFDSANISDFKSDYGGTILFRKKVDKYKFIGDLENGEYEISDFPFEDYYNDSDYYQLIEEGEYEYVDSKEINPINKYSEDLLIDVQHHYKNIYGNIKYNNIVVDNGKDFYDDDYKEYGCIQLRIADHSENVKNIDKFGDCDYYISVVIADKDNTKGKFSTSIFERRMNEVELKFNSDNTFDEVINKIENAITEGKEYVLNKKKMKFDSNKPDIRYDNGGEIENLILQGIIDLKFYETTQEHAKEYGLKSNKPIFVQNLCVSEKNRLKGIGNKVLEYIENYAQKNGNDVIFGYVANNASFSKDSRNTYFCDIDTIKNWLHSKGYAINNDNNDFHKQIATNRTFDKGGSVRLSKTPAPKKDRIYGSKINKPFSASSSEKAKSIKLDDKVIKSIKNILKEHNSKEGSIKIPLSTAKAVVRRGMGAYSVSHRPTISKGKKNSRVAWGLARLNSFVYKVQNGESKSGKYIQDDDLINELSNKLEYGGRVKASEFVLIDKNINKEELNAIEDVLLLDKFSKLDKDEAIFIYNQFKDYEKNVDEYGDYQIDFLLPIDDSEKEKEIKDFLEVIENNDFLYFDTWEEKLSATNKTTDFINSVRARLETIRLRKQGSDLFPEVESEKIQKRNALEAIESLKIMKELEPEKASVYDEAIEGLIAYSETIFDNGGQAEIKSENHEKFHLVYEGQKPIAKMKFDLSESNIDTITKKIDELTDRGYKIKQVNEDDFNSFSYSKVDPNDLRKFMQGIEYFKVGGKIEFDKNDLPNKNIYKYALNIKKNYPEIWKKGGNIFGNQAFENLERVIKRGYWLDSEAWMYVKWRAYVARHQRDYRIEGVIAMLKWIDEVERGWAYMKDLIEKYKSKYKKMNEGGEIKETEFVIVYTEKGLSFDFNVSKDLKLDEVVSICKQKSYPDKLNYFIWKAEKYKIQKI